MFIPKAGDIITKDWPQNVNIIIHYASYSLAKLFKKEYWIYWGTKLNEEEELIEVNRKILVFWSERFTHKWLECENFKINDG